MSKIFWYSCVEYVEFLSMSRAELSRWTADIKVRQINRAVQEIGVTRALTTYTRYVLGWAASEEI